MKVLFLFVVLFSISLKSFADPTCEQARADDLALLNLACSQNAGCYEQGTPGWNTIICYSYSGIAAVEHQPEQDRYECVRTVRTRKWENDEQIMDVSEDSVIGGTVRRCLNQPPPPRPKPDSPPGAGGGPGASGGAGGPGDCSGACCPSNPGGPNSPLVKSGSIVTVESRALGEILPIIGSNQSLYYYSAHQAGRASDYIIEIPLSGATPRSYVTSFTVEARRGGTLVNSATFSNVANQTYTYNWNGLDSLGSPVDTSTFEVTVKETSPSGTFSIGYKYILGHWNVFKLGLGGWVPTSLTSYDVQAKRLYYANGEFRKVTAIPYGTSQLYVAEGNGSRVYIFDSNGRHVQTKTSLLGTTIQAFAYDSSGRLSSITEPFGKVTTFNRNFSGALTSVTAPNSQVSNVSLDSNGYLSSLTNPNSETYSVTYNAFGLMQTFTKPNTEVNTFTFDSNGYLIKDSHSGGYFFDLIRTLNDAHDWDVQHLTVMGRSTQVLTKYSDENSSQTVNNPDGSVYTSTFYTDGNNTQKSINSGGYSLQFNAANDPQLGSSAKSLGQMIVTPSGGGAATYYDFTDSVTLSNPADPFSVTAATKSAGISGTNTLITTSFDPVTKKFSSSSYMGKTSERTIDTYERTVGFKVGSLNATSLIYTNENLTSMVQGTRTTTLGYNTLGLLQSVTNPLSQTTGYTYNSANRIATKVFPDSRVVNYGYDGVGNLTSLTPPSRPVHGFSINAHGLVGSYQPPTLSGVSTVNTTYTYNLDKQVTNISRPDGGYVSFNYNSSTGVLESLDTPAGNYPFYFDVVTGLPNSITTPSNIAINASYVGTNMAWIGTNVSGTSIGAYSKVFGVNERVDSDSVQSGGAGSTTSPISYLYNNDAELSKAGDVNITYHVPNGYITGTTMGTGTTGFTDTYTYNTYGEVTGYQAKRGTAIIYDLTLTRDGMGRISGKSQTMNSTTNAYVYNFDSSGRLDQVTKNSVVASNYSYDSNSNRISGNVGAQTTTATYDDQDRLLTYNTLSFTYNANGDLLTKTNSTTSQTTSYTYDVFGNLTQVVLPGATPTTITYEIDGLNRRVGKKVGSTVQRRFVYMDQYRIAAELNSAGTITKRFIYGSKSNIPDYMIASGVKYRIISDHLGSPRLVVKQSDGTITQRMDHDEFGRVIEDTNPGFTPFGFAGGVYDYQTGIVRFGARDYDPEYGRWTSKDPIIFKGGDSNLFGYVINDPVNLIDITGLQSVIPRPMPPAGSWGWPTDQGPFDLDDWCYFPDKNYCSSAFGSDYRPPVQSPVPPGCAVSPVTCNWPPPQPPGNMCPIK
ncbi:hypothetical protein DOM22_10925 [Bdellovibrio sp. ZAP7]|uniref:RHS repeat domain-containing protein n=1 Tax=Bdellovibrio sp. ZAP7 TaxID=2231053 RepID=UPI00115B69B4|nr:RHS repeat-associated core domain-containing protein [Bdellovibrio sp. ZAP7]QDK45624.1 hypothetical protein DOM22_10925 [Bdellovibrio sp. ZAP7]